MFFGIDLKELLYFPFKDADARKYFLIGSLISISAFVVPILPYFLLTGYAILIAQQVFRGESPRMVAWDDWGEMFKNGARVFGVRIIYSLPILILVLPMIIISVLMPVFASNSSTPESDPFFFVFMGTFALTMCLIIPVSIAYALFIPAAEMHVVDKGDFSAGFRIREWWAIFRANLSGFIAAFAIYYLISMVLAIVVQILLATLFLACLVPILLPAVTMYILLIMYVSIAQAYRDGKAKLMQSQPVTEAA